ncbi:hypothetical protein HanXRQr2_Chr09g0363681 [Helianthus annuus]|uniref:Uncharacterized protein n=1 Tax=Helianthus annuus TaxID=4232 RepID=A0A251TQZ3_HELAN|nr:hypothetical protein HanXRQr2_Chr09g0363681 [Helianthus annuus]KAJ0891206.1 hypothetical protein HanPSC8_Chr09g0350861 [Helianthus annuus]
MEMVTGSGGECVKIRQLSEEDRPSNHATAKIPATTAAADLAFIYGEVWIFLATGEVY